jgi:hypothetical protein
MVEKVEPVASHSEPDVEWKANIERLMRQIVNEANMGACRSIETLNAIEEVLKKLQSTYVEDPGLESAPTVSVRNPSEEEATG